MRWCEMDEERRRAARDRARERWIRTRGEALGEPTEDEIRRAKLDQRLSDPSFQWPAPYSTEQLAKIAQLLKADTADTVVKWGARGRTGCPCAR